MRALIIGGGGFVGGYLIDELTAHGYDVSATCLPGENISGACETLTLDIGSMADISDVLKKTAPDVVFHLAAQSSVALSWKKPQLTAEVNVIGSINLLEALRETKIRTVLIGSGEEYGYIRQDACPLTENEPLRPGNVYAATKACQEMLGQVYSRAYSMNIVMARSFNHTGPKQSTAFVISDFCRQAAEIELGLKEPVIAVGNLDAKRDFTDVRDVVRAYRLLGEKGRSGEVYNVGRGKAVSIGELLERIIGMADCGISIKTDKGRLRAADIPLIEPEVSKIFRDTGWKAEISLEKTIRDTLDYWRNSLAGEIRK
ncbi:MAG: GDP-mannose 4,6-dehydratase [Alistipes sp.]|nr:GDP-mannose 4,6-dehydratase [Alistipes sp.]